MPLIVEFEQCGTVRMFLFEVQIVHFRFTGRVSAFLADIHLCSALFISVLVLNTVHFKAMRFQGTPLRKGFLTKAAFIRTNT